MPPSTPTSPRTVAAQTPSWRPWERLKPPSRSKPTPSPPRPSPRPWWTPTSGGCGWRFVLDKSQRIEKYSSADFLAHAGIPTRIDAQHRIAHNKVMVIDGAVVITGSFNFTKGAEYDNAENLLVIRSQALAAQYTRNWEAHAAHSEPYTGR